MFAPKVECVILNSCYSEEQAKVISNHGIYVIGMNNTINDSSAIDFSVGFYQSIVAEKGYEFAFNMGKAIMLSKNESQASIPILWKDGIQI